MRPTALGPPASALVLEYVLRVLASPGRLDLGTRDARIWPGTWDVFNKSREGTDCRTKEGVGFKVRKWYLRFGSSFVVLAQWLVDFICP